MVNTSTRQLFDQLSEAEKSIRSKNINSDERLALANYIGNLYRALICMGHGEIEFDKYISFGGKRNYNKIVKSMNYYSDKLIKNFLENKKFHKNYFSEVLPDIEEEISKMKELDTNEHVYFKRKDFFEVFYQFMKSINLEELFDKLYKNNSIYSTIIGQDIGNVGFTLYNPLDGKIDLFIKDLKYSLSDMNTLAHEMGHCYDLSRFDGDVPKYNRFFYTSFYGEVISRLFERLLLDYLKTNNIAVKNVEAKELDFVLLNHDFLLQAFILSLFSNEFITKDKYLDCDSNEMVEMVKNHFIDESFIKIFIEGVISFDLSEIYNYAYGDIVSLFLFDEIKKYGFNNEMIEYFFNRRHELFNEDYLRECGYGPANYVKSYKKHYEHLKK